MKSNSLSSVAILCLTSFILAVPACSHPVKVEALATPPTSAAPELGTFGIDLSTRDLTVKPGDNFFDYANGTWLASFEIPADFSNYGSFTRLFERSEAQVRDIVESLAAEGADAGSNAQKIGDFYTAFMNTSRINAAGLAPAVADLNRIRSAQTHDDILDLMFDPSLNLDAPFTPYIYVDARQTDRYLVHFSQAGLALPDRDYYLLDQFAETRAAYRDHITRMLALVGDKNTEAEAEAILALETEIAKLHWPLEKQRDPVATYNLMTLNQLKNQMPEFSWDRVLAGAMIEGQTEFVVNEPDALDALAVLFTQTPVEAWTSYLKLHYLDQYAPYLPSQFDEENFEFFGKTLSGQSEQRARWKRGISAVNGAVGQAVGQLYVERHFPPESKAMMEGMIENIKLSLGERIDRLDWMSEGTKAEARDKLAKFRAYIGYPDTWRDFGDLEVSPDDALGNAKRANVCEWKDQVERLGRPVDPATDWGMLPHTVNAYYSPPRNAIYFPAAILQPPFFDPAADPAVNYGGIGAVIGHEIGHGFDDQGRKQDGNGILRDWWSAKDNESFEFRTAKLAAQYAAYSPLEGYFINPALTMGENVGDLGGLAVAYHAYKRSLKGAQAPVIEGLTGDQRFFLSWAQVWRRKYRDEDMIHRIYSDPHSPSEFRTNGIVRNMDEWYAAFDVQPGDALYLPPEQRVSIW